MACGRTPFGSDDDLLRLDACVKPDGTLEILNETWKVSKRLAGKYIWATILTHDRRLEIWYQPSAQHDWRLLKTRVYDLSESVARLKPEFAHHKKASHCSRCPGTPLK